MRRGIKEKRAKAKLKERKKLIFHLHTTNYARMGILERESRSNDVL